MFNSFLKYLFFLIILVQILPMGEGPVRAEETPFQNVSLNLSWSPVAGNRGYSIEVRHMNTGKVEQKTTTTERLSLSLVPGTYEIRLAALNKFRKPSAWSSWKSVEITGKTAQQDLDTSEESTEQEEESSNGDPFHFSPTVFVPGLVRYQNDSWAMGSLWIGGMVGFTGLAISEGQVADRIAHDTWNDPGFLALALYNEPLLTLFMARQRRLDQKERYNKHVRNQIYAGSAAFLLYGFQVLDATIQLNSNHQPVSLFTGLDSSGSLQAGFRFSVEAW